MAWYRKLTDHRALNSSWEIQWTGSGESLDTFNEMHWFHVGSLSVLGQEVHKFANILDWRLLFVNRDEQQLAAQKNVHFWFSQMMRVIAWWLCWWLLHKKQLFMWNCYQSCSRFCVTQVQIQMGLCLFSILCSVRVFLSFLCRTHLCWFAGRVGCGACVKTVIVGAEGVVGRGWKI